ncbi:multidrug resistance-associated protein 5-like isoform X2 [Anneissia japonica]|uniref:multidrug resistance-associated protein 5-like isoform X2 n=1 Tax=Anneissia japonica TaxID=1529436 RepID=UPI00142560A4|nr:multidrug resistance-associated protein 5-like isoform X2 [Anneissia japonica]
MVSNNEKKDVYVTEPVTETQENVFQRPCERRRNDEDIDILNKMITSVKLEDSDNYDFNNSFDGGKITKNGTFRPTKNNIQDDSELARFQAKKWSRYRQSLQGFKPYRKPSATPARNPIDDAGLLSIIYVTWLTSLFKKAIRVPLQIADLFPCSSFDSAKVNSSRLERLWEEELYLKGPKNASFLRTALRFLRTRFILGLTLVGLCFCMGMMNAIINICTNDSMRFYDIALFLSYPIIGPFVTIFGIAYVVNIIGPAALVGTSLMLIFFMYQICTARIVTKLRRNCLRTTDKRVRMINELIICIKLIKMYAWEIPFSNVISEIRKEEKSELQKAGFLTSFNSSSSPLICALASITTFSVHIALGNSLTAAQAFTYIAVINSMRVLYLQTPNAVRCMADCAVAAQRMKQLLLIPDAQVKTPKPSNHEHSIEIVNGTFGWNSTPNEKRPASESDVNPSEENTLINSDDVIDVIFDINLNVKKGELIGVCGSVGSGKTSLLSALLCQMEQSNGSIATDGSFAYAAQEPMILNETLKENILFGNELHKQKYDSALFSCCLQQDIDILPCGDETEIGERGINLSGGQKQRVSLARALYAEKDIYLLDDPLSAVDVHVGQHIFTNAIKEALKDKTVLFVTHQLQYLKQCDKVLMLKGGAIVEAGPFQELLAADKEFSKLINKYYNDLSESESDFETAKNSEAGKHTSSLDRCISTSTLTPALSADCLSIESTCGVLTNNEINEAGSVKMETYIAYIKAAGGYTICLLTVFSFVLMVGTITFSQWWLSKWLEQGGGGSSIIIGNISVPSDDIRDNPQLAFYQQTYILTAVAVLLFSILKSFIYIRTTLVASSSLHDSVLRKVFNSPMIFFDTTPSGQIMNRFSQDLDEVDVQLPITMEMFFLYLFGVLFALIVISVVFPMNLIGLAISFVLFAMLGRLFKRCLSDLKRLDNISRAPYLSHLTATIQGVQTVRAYAKENHFNNRFEEMVDTNSVPLLLFVLSNRWLAVRFDLFVMFMSVSVGAFAVITHGQVSSAMVGLAITFSAYLLGSFQYTIRLCIESEARFTSAERLINYMKNLESEGQITKCSQIKLDASWPAGGEIVFKDVKMRYRDNLPLVLNGITLHIKSNEKIGIVGRTGSGKSSLGVCIYRLVELSSGFITIDGIDISTLDLQFLRSKLAIIPQDPVLFVGTIRLVPWSHS